MLSPLLILYPPLLLKVSNPLERYLAESLYLKFKKTGGNIRLVVKEYSAFKKVSCDLRQVKIL